MSWRPGNVTNVFSALMTLRTNKLERLGPANCFSLVYHSSVKPEPGSTKKFEDIIFVCNFRLLPLWVILDYFA